MSTYTEKANISMWPFIEKAIDVFMEKSTKQISDGNKIFEEAKAKGLGGMDALETYGYANDLKHLGQSGVDASNHTKAYWKSHFGIPSTETMVPEISTHKYKYTHKYIQYLELQSIIEEIIKSEENNIVS